MMRAMKQVTLCFLLRDEDVCLAMKKRGFGKGKWNGMGGKVDANESTAAAALRELKEEVGVSGEVGDLKKVANIKFFFIDKPEWDQQMHVYTLDRWVGEPIETVEMRPQWFNKYELPYDSMWIDDVHWVPKILNDEIIEGEFRLIDQGGKIQDFEIHTGNINRV